MKLTSKLQWSFAIPTAFLVIMGSSAIFGFGQINNKVGSIYNDRVVPLKQLKEISDEYAVNVIDTVNKAHAGIITTNQALSNMTRAQDTIEQVWQEYRQTYLTAEEKALADEVEGLFGPADREIQKVEEVLKQGNASLLGEFDGPLYQVVDPVSETIQKLIELQLDVALKEYEASRSIYNTILWTFIPFMALAIIAVVGPVRVFINRALIAALRDTINAVASASSEIAAATEQQERLAAQQSASVNETTTTMDELNNSSQQSAQQAETATSGAQQVLNLSREGNQAVAETLQGMTELKERVNGIAKSITLLSEQIGQINTYQQLVADLANQTNMLALNAAVEAVRAGEHGKGFAVVASEIRKLADQSKQSADKINQLVTDIQQAINATVMATESGTKTVDSGVDLAQRTAATFNRVSQSIDEVVVNIQQISLNTKQQSVAIGQVVDAMNTLNQAAMQTASGVNQTKIGTQKLSDTANELQAMV